MCCSAARSAEGAVELAVADVLSRRRGVIVILVLVSITLLTLDLRGNAVIDAARGIALDVTAPLRQVGETVASPFQNAWRGVVDYEDLRLENERLRDEIERQEAASIGAEAQVREYQDLLELNKLPSVAGIPTVLAQVISQPASNFDLTIEVNQGADEGIRVGMPVVNSAGLIGRVTRVTDTRSIVRLITDPELNVAVKISGAPPPTTTTLAPVPTVPGAVPGVTAPPPPEVETDPIDPATVDVSSPPPASLPSAPAASPTATVPDGPLYVRELGILHGEGRGRPLVVDFVDVDTPVREGDPVVTSGVDQSLSPPDIPIGRVASVRRAAGSFQLDVTVEPAAALDDLTSVMVLLYVPEL